MNQRHPALLLTAVLPCVLLYAARGQDEASEDLRPYEAGPLDASEFRAAVPNPQPRENGIRLEAYTATDIRYELRYYFRTSSTQTRLSLESIEVNAVFDRSKSWNNRKSDRHLLDHEQGHFDLAAIYALRLQLEFDRQLRAGPGIITVGRDEEQAALNMRREIDRQIGIAVDAVIKANREYDRITAHGSKHREQVSERRKQMDELSRLIEDLRESRE